MTICRLQKDAVKRWILWCMGGYGRRLDVGELMTTRKDMGVAC